MAQQPLAQLPKRVSESLCATLGPNVLDVEFEGRRFFHRHCGKRMYQLRVPVHVSDYDIVIHVCGECGDVQKHTEYWLG